MKNIYRIGFVPFLLLFAFSLSGNDAGCYTADSCHKLGVESYKKGRYIKSIKYNKEAESYRLINKDGLLWKSRRNIALAYNEMSLFNEANLYFIKAYETNGKREAKDSVKLLINIGICFLEMGDIEQAVEYGINAIKINNHNLSEAYAILSSILNETNNENQIRSAIRYANKAIELSHNNQNQENILRAINEKGTSYNKLELFKQAIDSYNSAYDISVEIGDTIDSSGILNNIATVFFIKNNIKMQ